MWRRVVGVVIVVAAAILAVGLFLPGHSHVQRTVEIAAPPNAVYSILNGYRRFNEWSPWFALDPKAQYSYSGPPAGIGAHMDWRSTQRNVGNGSQEVIANSTDRSVTHKLVFEGMNPSVARFDLAPTATGTSVTWNMDSDLGHNPVNRYFGLILDRMIGPDFETGLRNLKAVAEKSN